MEIRRTARFERVEPYPYTYDGFTTEYEIEDEEYESDEIEKVDWNNYKKVILDFVKDLKEGEPSELPGKWKIIVQFAMAGNDCWIPMEKYTSEVYLDDVLKEIE